MTISYTLASHRGKVAGKETAYIGQVIHNHTLDLDAMSKDYAAKRKISEEDARFQLSCVGSYIAEAVTRGNRLNFREFSVSLKMTGTFSRGNERYDAVKNPLKVVMTPSKVLQEAVRSLEPVNITEKLNPRIENIIHDTVKEGRVYLNDTIRLDGALTTMNASYCRVDRTVPDEGVFLTALDDETPLLQATVVDVTMGTCDVRFPKSDLPAGEYYILIKSRSKKGLPLVSARRKVKVVE